MEKILENVIEKDFKPFQSVLESLEPATEFYESLFKSTFNYLFDRAADIRDVYLLKVVKLKMTLLETKDDDHIFVAALVKLFDELDGTLSLFDAFTDDYLELDGDIKICIAALQSEKQNENELKLLALLESSAKVIVQKHLIIREQLNRHELAIKKFEETLNRNVN